MSQSPRQCSILSLGVRGLSSCTISVLLLCTEKVPSEKKVKSLSHVRLCDLMDCSPPGSSVHEFPRQEYWSGLPFPTPGDLASPGTEPSSLALAGGFFTAAPCGKPH